MKSPAREPRQRARDVLAAFGVTQVPIPVDAIAKAKGVSIQLLPLEDELSGMIFLKDGAPIVVVNSLHSTNRRRFTIAHELGHFELHMREIGQEVHVDKKYFVMARDGKSSRGFDSKEIEANRFATELLVPRHFLTRELRGRVVDFEDEELVSELARTFEVSSQMMSIRIGELAASARSP
jgi:Zn-dependent peptidase ImmA (M78 family)